MRITFFGDSITDADRFRNSDGERLSLGTGFVMQVAGRLYEKSLTEYDVRNRGISGNRIVDLYARVKMDVWNKNPAVLNILIGVNDVWHEIKRKNGVEIDRFEKVYRMMIEETLEKLPNIKIILNEPFVLKGSATEESYNEFLAVKDYAKVVRRLAEEYGLYFLPLQEPLEKAAEIYGAEVVLPDGVHPSVQGAVVIANEWMKLFEKIEKEIK